MPTVWGLLDDRAGNTAQVRGVVERLGYPHQFKQIRYSPCVRLPNLVRGRSLRGVSLQKSDPLQPPWPDVVVTAGRRLAPVALYIKRQQPETFLVQMMSPGIAAREFDVLALPSHDKVLNLPGMVRTLGAPHHMTPETLRQALAECEPLFARFPGFRIGVLVGGHSPYGKMREEDIKHLLFHITRVAGMASLLVTTSRRTPRFAYPMMEAALKDRPHYFYRYGQPEGINPYTGILASADMLIITGDSISMCSEACSTGKPVYIFAPEKTLSPKHKRFLSMLFEQHFARPLGDYDAEWRPTNVLDEAGRLAAIIRQKLSDRQELSKL